MTSARTVVVTGATGTIGQATVARLLEAGDTYVVASGSRAAAPDELAALAGDERLRYIACDVRDERQVSELVSAASSAFAHAPLGGAANVAGVVGDSVTTIAYDADRWQRVVDVNLRGTWLCLKHEITALLAGGRGGAIVNVSSIAGHVGEVERSPYVASKAGVVGLTKTAAVEYAADGIRVNAVSPGPIDTPQFHLNIGPPGSPRYEQLRDQQPIRRMGRAEEAADAIAWLLSDHASFVVGHELIVDGGLTSEGVRGLR